MILPNDSIIEVEGDVYSISMEEEEARMIFLFSNRPKKTSYYKGLDFMLRVGVNPLQEPSEIEIQYIMEVFEYYDEYTN